MSTSLRPPTKPAATKTASRSAVKPAKLGTAVAPHVRLKPAAEKLAPAAKTAKPVTAASTQASTAVVAKVEKASKALKQVVKTVKTVKTDKPKKPKLVRDSYTIPREEYATLETLKRRTALAGQIAKKSELLRAGIRLLASLDDAALVAAARAVPALKPGRPAQS